MKVNVIVHGPEEGDYWAEAPAIPGAPPQVRHPRSWSGSKQ